MRYKGLILAIVIPLLLFLNAGNFLDVTDEPLKVDIIVSLGGGTQKRLEKSLELFKYGYSKTDKLIYTGTSAYRTKIIDYTVHQKRYFFEKRGIMNENLVHIKAGNTYREVKYVKEYMLQNHLKSVLFVTDPPHSRRVKFLAHSISNYNKDNLRVFVVGSDVEWWRKGSFFLHKNAIVFTISELMKLPYNYIAFGILKEYGVYEFVKKNFGVTIHKVKDLINESISREWE